MRIDAESDEYEVVSVVAVKPSWRDVWAILRGRYEPKVRKVKRLTPAGVNRVIKDVWSHPRLTEQLYAGSPFKKSHKPMRRRL